MWTSDRDCATALQSSDYLCFESLGLLCESNFELLDRDGRYGGVEYLGTYLCAYLVYYSSIRQRIQSDQLFRTPKRNNPRLIDIEKRQVVVNVA